LRELADVAPEWFPGEAEPEDLVRSFVGPGAVGPPIRLPEWPATPGAAAFTGLAGEIVRDSLKGREPIRQKGKIVGYQDVIQDQGVEDKRLLLLEPEFGGVLQALNRDGNKLSAVIRQAWDSDTMAILTKS
jgi:hypothetical protein